MPFAPNFPLYLRWTFRSRAKRVWLACSDRLILRISRGPNVGGLARQWLQSPRKDKRFNKLPQGEICHIALARVKATGARTFRG